MSYKIAICDNEHSVTEYIHTLVTKWATDSGAQVQIDTFLSAEAFLFQYIDHQDYDILLLDIAMGALNGVDLAKYVRKNNETIQIIFITAYPDFISEGYEVAALHYLMKPVSSKKLAEVLDRAISNLQKRRRTVVLHVGGAILRIVTDEIWYVEVYAHSLSIVTGEQIYEVRMPLAKMEKLLGDGFIRCHRSYIVGVKHIAHITKSTVMLDCGKVLPLSRSAVLAVHEVFISYYKGEKLKNEK